MNLRGLCTSDRGGDVWEMFGVQGYGPRLWGVVEKKKKKEEKREGR